MNVALRPDRLDILSLCTGGGGLDLGVELAIPSARSVCMVEREAYAVAQLVSAMEAGLMAPAPVWSDARTFDGRRWRGCVDGLIGGIPCQPHSLAGKRQGEDDERDLWSTARRIIVQSRVWFALIENVSGMLSSGGAKRIWRDLRRLGFSVEGGLFKAAEVGASHQRERLIILAVANCYSAGLPLWWGQAASPERADADRCGTEMADAECHGRRQGANVLQPWANQPVSAFCGADLADPGSDGQQRRSEPHFRSDGCLQQTPRRCHAQRCDCIMGDPARRGRDGRQDDPIGRSIKRTSPEGTSGHPFLFAPGPGDLSRWGDTLASAPELEPAVRRVADGLASRLDIARVDRLRLLGNGVVPLQAAYAVRTLATRLADSGSAGAARLVRMMEVA